MILENTCNIISDYNRLQSSTTRQVVDLFEEATLMFVNLTNLDAITHGLYLHWISANFFFFFFYHVWRDETDVFNIYNEIFTLFDEATRSFGLEKIKTVLMKKLKDHIIYSLF